MKFDIDYVEKLAKVLADNSLTEISLEDGEQAITLRKEVMGVAAAPVAAPVAQPVQAAPAAQAAPAEAKEVKKGKPLTSPMVGTFYGSSSPKAEPFVKIGDKVKKGQVVCIVEAMKLMNEVESEFDGEIVEICKKDEEMVEYGEILFKIK